MKKRLPSVIIGIPAYNEQANITFLLNSILLQKQTGWILKGIYVMSDGSTDHTENCVNSFYSKLIVFNKGKKRHGKTYRLNEFFEKVNSDIVITLDADIRMKNADTLNNLVKPMLKNKKLMYVSGSAQPDRAKNLVQSILRHGALIWEDLRLNKGLHSVYLSEGRIRAFRKNLYKSLRFPMTSAEDVYPYLYCKQHKLKSNTVLEAKVYYKLPKTFSDFVKQMRRFLKSKTIHSHNFPEKLIQKEYSIELSDKFYYFVKKMLRHPIKTSLYGLFLAIPKILNYLDIIRHFEVKAKWDVAQSTK